MMNKTNSGGISYGKRSRQTPGTGKGKPASFTKGSLRGDQRIRFRHFQL